MYDPHAALLSIDAHAVPIMACLAVAVFFSFVYFGLAFHLARKQQVYVVPFIGAALFFWHDLSFVLSYDLWFNVYNHWWVKMWWFALCGTVAFEVLMIWQVYRYGHQELWPGLSRRAYAALLVLGTLGIGAMWYLIKASLNDELYFVTFIITAVFSVPFHTGIMARRQSRAGQSIIMEGAVIIIQAALWGVCAMADTFFLTAPVLIFVAVFTLWPLANIALILRFPKYQPVSA